MWRHIFLVSLSIQQHFVFSLGKTLRRPQQKQRSTHSKVRDHNLLPPPKREVQKESQCTKEVKEKYGKEAVAIEKCAEVRKFKKKLSEALKVNDRHEAFNICEDILMNCVGLSMLCAKQQIPLMLGRADEKKAKGQLETLKQKDSSKGARIPDKSDVAASARHMVQHQQTHSSSQAASQDTNGMLELCNHNGLRVVLDTHSNSRRMTFGDNAWEKLIQTAVNCKGEPAPSCRAATGSNSCDLSPKRCPCEFQMESLPPLDHEYIYIADQVIEQAEASLEKGWGSIRGPDTAVMPGGLRMALVGLGGGMIAQYLISHSIQLKIDAIELNADVVAAARAFFGVAHAESQGRLHVLEGDGASVLGEASPATYGVVVVDCFGAQGVPLDCRSQAFAEAAHRAMKPGGQMLQNVVISRPDDAALDKRLRQEFEELLAAYRKVFGEHAVELESKWAHGSNAVVRARKSGGVRPVSLLSSLLDPSEDLPQD
jgi:hypothetical protein